MLSGCVFWSCRLNLTLIWGKGENWFFQNIFAHDCREKLYHKLSFESFVSRRWYRKLCCFYKVFKLQSPRYLLEVIPTVYSKRAYITRNNDKLAHFKVKHNYFKNPFFPSTVIEWNKLDLNIRHSESLTSFESKVLKFIHPCENSIVLFQ